MDGKHKVQIVDFKVIPYTNKKTGAREEMRLAQCVVTSASEEGEGADRRMVEKTVVGELMMPKHLASTPKGSYLAEFELAVGQDLRIGSRLTGLHPIGASKAPQPKAA